MRLTKLVQKHIPEVLAKLPSKKLPPPFLCTSLHKSFWLTCHRHCSNTEQRPDARNIWDPRPRPGFISYHSGQVAACPQAIHWCCWIVYMIQHANRIWVDKPDCKWILYKIGGSNSSNSSGYNRQYIQSNAIKLKDLWSLDNSFMLLTLFLPIQFHLKIHGINGWPGQSNAIPPQKKRQTSGPKET